MAEHESRGRERTRSPAPANRRRPSLLRGRSASRVRFPAALVRRRSVSQPPPAAAGGAERKAAPPGALKAPKYQACPAAMRRQLDENEKQQVTYMSYDINLAESDVWNSFVEGARTEDGPVLGTDHSRDEEAEEELSRMLSLECKVDHEEGAGKELRKMEAIVQDSIALHESRINTMLPEEYEMEERSAGSGRGGGSRILMPLPQNGEREERVGGRGHVPQMQRLPANDGARDASSLGGGGRGRSGPPPGGAPSRRSRSLRPERIVPDPVGLHGDGDGARRSLSQDPRRAASRRRPPPPPPLPSSLAHAKTPLGAAPLDRKGMVAAPSGADEASVLSSMGNSAAAASVISGSSNGSHGSRHRPDQEVLEEDTREDVDKEDDKDIHEEGEETDPAAALIDTANYDSKGRCVHHPHVRLRKKKMFGKWKTLMSACPECCLDALRSIHAADERKRKMAKKKPKPAAENWVSDRSQRDDGESRAGLHTSAGVRSAGSVPGSASVRSFGSVPVGAFAGAALGSWRRTPRSTSVPPQTTTPVHPRRSPSQESSRSRLASVPPRPRGRRSPSQNSYRSAPASRRSPSLDSFRRGGIASSANGTSRQPPQLPLQPKEVRPITSDGSTSTASLTESDRDSALRLLKKKKTRSKSIGEGGRSFKNGDLPPPSHSAPERGLPQPGKIHVRQMQWTDAKGNSGSYTGQVNAQFAPRGNGSMTYDASGKTKEGKWKNGKCRRDNSAEGFRSWGCSASQVLARPRSMSRQPQPRLAEFNYT